MSELPLFDDAKKPKAAGSSHKIQELHSPPNSRAVRVEQSALWSAYGDALGWISELTSEAGLRRRTGGAPLQRPIRWKRRIGGRSGVTVDLPQGCYSDDSQLRLATSRSIGSDGFDIEAFSKVELPVWLSYALGGGRSTSAAARNLKRRRVQWFDNTFRGWTNSGGNGAAMRIQPHVWAARDPSDPTTFLPDVVRNAVCTHSHPYGLLGAVLHALALARALSTGHHPSPDDLAAATNTAADLLDLVGRDVEVAQYWRANFERDSGSFSDAWARAIDECRKYIQVAAEASGEIGDDRYGAMLGRLMLRDPTQRGNGMLTALAAVGLIWCEPRPEEALTIAANAIGTDTDTIATMAGAILGVNAKAEPPVEVLDADLFRTEANRLSEIAAGKKPLSYRYPDLLRWLAPKTQADALVRSDRNGVFLLGLGRAEIRDEAIQSPNSAFMWQWIKLHFGQTLLVKRRRELASVSDEYIARHAVQFLARPQQPTSGSKDARRDQTKPRDGRLQGTKPSLGLSRKELNRSIKHPQLEDMIRYLETNRYEDASVGKAIRRVVNKCTSDQIATFLGVLIARLRESPSPSQDGN